MFHAQFVVNRTCLREVTPIFPQIFPPKYGKNWWSEHEIWTTFRVLSQDGNLRAKLVPLVRKISALIKKTTAKLYSFSGNNDHDERKSIAEAYEKAGKDSRSFFLKFPHLAEIKPYLTEKYKKTLKESGWPAIKFANAGYTPSELKKGGFSAFDLTKCGFSLEKLKNASFTLSELWEVRSSERVKDFYEMGFRIDEFMEAGDFDIEELKSSRCWSARELIDAGFPKDHDAFEVFRGREKGKTAREQKDENGNLKAFDFKFSGYESHEELNSVIHPHELKSTFGFPDLESIINAGYEYSIQALKDSGFTASQVREIGSYSDEEIIHAGYSAVECKDAGISKDQLLHEGFAPRLLADAGFEDNLRQQDWQMCMFQ